MKKKLKKRKLLILVMCSFLLITSCQKDTNKKQIFEINDTKQTGWSIDSYVLTYRRHFMMTQPAEDLNELKAEIDNFLLNYPLDFEAIIEEAERSISTIEEGDVKKVDVELYFYRESHDLPIDWKPDEGYFSIDRIDHHKEDLIASVCWTDLDQGKRYSLIKKGKEKDNYGDVIEYLRYYEDELIESFVEEIDE